MPDFIPLGLGLDASDVAAEDLIRTVVRRLAQIEVQLRRIADTADQRLKLEAIRSNLTLAAIRQATEEDSTPAAQPAAPMELLSQTPEELAELEATYQRVVERRGLGNVPLGLDLYAEVAKEKDEEPDEAPEA